MIGLILSQIGHLIAALVVGWVVIASLRWVGRRSQVLGTIVAITIVTRVALGLALFWISYLKLPIAESLQAGDGFWQLAIDSTGYFRTAAGLADAHALIPLDHVLAAPFYVDALAVWMMVVGISPVAGMFLNLCLYLAFVVLMVWTCNPVNDWRRDLACIVGVAAYSFSPVILIHSTQPLKDEVFYVLVALACFGVLGIARLMHNPDATRGVGAIAAGAVAVCAAIVGVAGIRWYYGFCIWCALALMLAIFAVRGRRTSLPRYLAGSVLVLMVAWLGFWGGAGPYYWNVVPELNRPGELAGRLAASTQTARIGFLATPGATNIVVAVREDSPDAKAYIEAFERSHYDAAVRALARRPEAERRAAAARQAEEARLAEAKRRAEEARRAEAERRAEEARRAEMERKAAARSAAARRAAARRTGGAAATGVPAEPEATTPTPAEPEATTPAPTPAELAAQARAREAAEAARRRIELAIPVTIRQQLAVVATGLALIVSPVSLVKAFAAVDIGGGRGLLRFVDLDTIFLDATFLCVLALLWKRRGAIGDRLPFVVFALILSAATAVLLGYVVTNYGTLWRLRSVIGVPLWVLVVALSPRAERPRESSDGSDQVPTAP